MMTWTASKQNFELQIAIERERRRRAQQARAGALPDAPGDWLRSLFPAYVAHPFAPRHDALWAWAWPVALGQNVDPFVACWGRGGAKSTSAELVTVRWAAAKTRRYGLYLC